MIQPYQSQNAYITKLKYLFLASTIKLIVSYLTFNSPMLTFNILGNNGIYLYGISILSLILYVLYHKKLRYLIKNKLILLICLIIFNATNGMLVSLYAILLIKTSLTTSYLSITLTLLILLGHLKRYNIMFSKKETILFIFTIGIFLAVVLNLFLANQIIELYASMTMIVYYSIYIYVIAFKDHLRNGVR
ncbi:MAG: hypothetical protein ACRCTA_04755 [Bacilli bacterium]